MELWQGAIYPRQSATFGKFPNVAHFSSILHLLLTIFTTWLGFFQRSIGRRAVEDAAHPRERWGVDRAEQDPEDFYPEAHLPKPPAIPRRKDSATLHTSDNSDDDCVALEIVDAVPLSVAPPDPNAPSASGKRKAPSSTSTEAPSTAAPPAPSTIAGGRSSNTPSEGPSTDAPSAPSRGRGGRRPSFRTKKPAPARHQVHETAEAEERPAKKKKTTVRPFKRAEYVG